MCVICLALPRLELIRKDKCGHIFCMYCVEKWINLHNKMYHF